MSGYYDKHFKSDVMQPLARRLREVADAIDASKVSLEQADKLVEMAVTMAQSTEESLRDEQRELAEDNVVTWRRKNGMREAPWQLGASVVTASGARGVVTGIDYMKETVSVGEGPYAKECDGSYPWADVMPLAGSA